MKTLTDFRYASCLALSISLVIFVGTTMAQSMPQPVPQPMAQPTPQLMPATSNMVNPQRWTEPDVTPAQKLSTATKEAVNAHQQFLDECKSGSSAQYAACAAAVHQTYEQERADIRRRFPQ